jgi:hypothetical protein
MPAVGLVAGEQSVNSPAPSADPAVGIALGLGWQMVELYLTASPSPGQPPRRQPQLPSLSDLTSPQRTELGLAQIDAALAKLASALRAAGLAGPTTAPVEQAFRVSPPDRDGLHDTVYDLHLELLNALQACDPRLGTAYRLGKALAYTCLLPNDAPSLREEFQQNRLNNLQEWLADLATALPGHAARAVAISLDLWQQVIPNPGATEWTAPPDTLPALHRQGKLWRAILTGEKNPRDMLTPAAYITAAAELLSHTRRLVGHFLWRYLPAIVFVVVLLLGAGAVVIFVGPVGKVFAALLPLAAALGITSKGLIAALRSTASKLEQPLWGAELDTAIGAAITVAPGVSGTGSAKETAKTLTPVGPRVAAPELAPGSAQSRD